MTMTLAPTRAAGETPPPSADAPEAEEVVEAPEAAAPAPETANPSRKTGGGSRRARGELPQQRDQQSVDTGAADQPPAGDSPAAGGF
jgi:hypothetical protein